MAFDLNATLNSGQIFRWKKTINGAFICHRDKVFFIGNDGLSDYEDIDYFLRNDQLALSHPNADVQKAIDSYKGLRVLRQDPWECLVTFIISQNNNIKRITKNVNDLCRLYGMPLEEGFYSFPTPSSLASKNDLLRIGLGYRADYVFSLRNIDLKWLYGLKELSYYDAKKSLTGLKGVGPKVADCVLLFSLGFDEACPEDTWIKKVFSTLNITRYDLGSKAGILQQYLFHASREGIIDVN